MFFVCSTLQSLVRATFHPSGAEVRRSSVRCENRFMSMDELKDFQVVPLTDSAFVKPLRLTYDQGGRRKAWDLVRVHDSVGIVVFNVTRQKLLFVRQFRPAVYFNGIPSDERDRLMQSGSKVDCAKYPVEDGYTLEICAGIVDKKDASLQEIAAVEVEEELGYKVDPASLERMISMRSGVGVMGDKQTHFYAEVTDDMKVSSGGGNDSEGERIEVVEMSIGDARNYIAGPSVISPPELLFGVMWFLMHKAGKFEEK